MSTTTLTRPTSAAPTTGGHRDERRSPLMRPYLGYVGYFVGAGLISGGIVHHPLDPGLYTAIAAAGVGLFLAATVLNEVVLGQTRLTPRGVARIVVASLLLSIGIGMLSGGIQHFTDFPDRAATLIPCGMVLSFAAYMLRHGAHDQPHRLGVMAAGVVLAAGATFFALGAVADTLASSGAGGHGHGHGVAPAEPAADLGTDQHAPADTHRQDTGHEEVSDTGNQVVEPAPAGNSGDHGADHGTGHGSGHGSGHDSGHGH